MVSLKDKDENTPLPGYRRYLNRIPAELKVLFVASLIFLFVIGYMGRGVPNLQYLNNSDPGAKPVFEYHEGFTQVVLYDENDLDVPYATIPPSLLYFYMIFIIILIIYVANKTDEADFITAEQARYVIRKWWNYGVTNGLVQGKLNLYSPFPQQHLRTRESGGKVKPYEWVIPGRVKEEDNTESYIVFGVNPYNYHIYMATKTTREFSRRDLCPNCGDYHDIKVMDTEEYERFKQLMIQKPK